MKKEKDQSNFRELLRSAGYLENMLEGFLLKNILRKGSILIRMITTCLKVGVGVGFAMAIIFAAAISYFTPALQSNLKDIFILVIYLWMTFAVMLSVLSFIIGLIILFAQRYTRGGKGKLNVSLITAIIVSIGIFIYLSLWWVKASSGRTFSGSGLGDLLALAIIFIISFLIGRLTFATGLAIIARSEKEIAIGRLLRLRLKHFAVIAAAALMLFALLFFIGGSRIIQPEPRKPSDYNIKFNKNTLLIIAIDGFDARIVENLSLEGKLPFIFSIKQDGAEGKFILEDSKIPPVFWTTIATGMVPVKHGIGDFSTRRLAGLSIAIQTGEGSSIFNSVLTSLVPTEKLSSTVPITANLRRSKTFWNILNDKTLSTGIINWWVTWPCDDVNGFLVSERLLYKLETGGEWDREIIPQTAFDEIRDAFPKWKSDFEALFLSVFGNSPYTNIIREGAWIDFFQMKCYTLLAEKNSVRIAAIYLPGADIIQNKLMTDQTPSQLSALNEKIEALIEYYKFLDAQLQQLNAGAAGFTHTLILISPGRPVETGAVKIGSGEGLFIINGDGIKNTASEELILRPIDVTPTILYLLGFPQSEEMEGRPLIDCFTSEMKSSLKLQIIPTFGDRLAAAEEEGESQFSEKVLEQLRDLGYIK